MFNRREAPPSAVPFARAFASRATAHPGGGSYLPPISFLRFTVPRHADRVPGPMRLSVFGSIVRAILFLLPAAVTLTSAFFIWASRKRPELSERRARIFRWSLTSAWIATALFFVASIDQLKTRQLLPGFWLVLNLAAALLAMVGFAGAASGRGWARTLLLTWGVLLMFGIFMVVVSTIP